MKSKKNQVFCESVSDKGFVIRKIFRNEIAYTMELEVMEILISEGVKVPQVLDLPCANTVIYEYIPGMSVIEQLERLCMENKPFPMEMGKDLMDLVAKWSWNFHECMLRKKGEPWILGDSHLRNFIYHKDYHEMYGIDFEDCRRGKPETDIARLTAFILTYDLEWEEEEKKELANYFMEVGRDKEKLDEALLRKELERELREIKRRRGILRE